MLFDANSNMMKISYSNCLFRDEMMGLVLLGLIFSVHLVPWLLEPTAVVRLLDEALYHSQA